MFQARSEMRALFTRWALGAAFLAVATYAFVTLRGPRGIHALVEKQRLIQEMEKRNAAEAQQIERIKEHIQRLNDNPEEQELEIKERYKLVHPGEEVFITGAPEKK
jgi:cell division protein FtsB